jgi:Mg-chelatase subunit ChlD
MTRNLQVFIYFLFISCVGHAQIIFDRTKENIGEIKSFNGYTADMLCTNKSSIPIVVYIDSISEFVEVKLPSDTIYPGEIYTVKLNLYPSKIGSLREKAVLSFSDGTNVSLHVTGYISAFTKTYWMSMHDNQLTSEKEIIFMLVDGITQKPVAHGKIYISNLANYKSYIGYSDQYGILKNRVPEGRYLLQCLADGYKREIMGVKIDPTLNVATVLLEKFRPEDLIKKPIPVEQTIPQPLAIDSAVAPILSTTQETTTPPAPNFSISQDSSAHVSGMRRPLNIIMLIDNSASMAYEKRMEKVKESIYHLIDNYGKDDQIAVLTFNEQVNTIISTAKITDAALLKNIIGAIEISGKTDGETGINTAFEMMEAVGRKECLNMIVLATDGRMVNSTYSERKILKRIEDMSLKGYLTSVMGFTSSNYHGKKMQQMADIGGGIYLNMNSYKENYNSLLLDEIYKTLLKIE